MKNLRIIPDGTTIPFMKGARTGLIISALLSLLSIGLYFYPGLNLGIDFRGGIVMEVRTPQPLDFPTLRNQIGDLSVGHANLQQFGSPNDVLIRLERQEGSDDAQQVAINKVRAALSQAYPGLEVRRVEAVGGAVSEELFANGMTALGLSLIAMLIYIWFRFDWQFGAGAVATLILDVTKTVGFFAITGIQFNLVSIAAVLTIMGFSINDKVVVYDRVRENLRKYKAMPLREVIDRSINEVLNRTFNTSGTTLLATLPLALFGGEAVRDFAITLIFGIALATSSSIFIAAPILLYLGEKRLGRSGAAGGAEEAAPKPAV